MGRIKNTIICQDAPCDENPKHAVVQAGKDNNSSASTTGASTGRGDALEGVAQEVYRVVLFVVFYAEVWALGNVPYAGLSLYAWTLFHFIC